MRSIFRGVIIPAIFATYALLGLGFYAFLESEVPDRPTEYHSADERLVVVALDIATGSSPQDYDAVLNNSRILLWYAWSLRMLSWLIVPALVGLIVGWGVAAVQLRLARWELDDDFLKLAEELNIPEQYRESYRDGLKKRLRIPPSDHYE